MIYLRIPFSCFFQVLYHSIKTGIRGTCPPTGVGAEPLLHPVSTRPTSAASGAAQPPRPPGASFRRKREPRGAVGRRKLVQTLCVETGVRGTCPPTGVRGRSPCKWDVSPDGGRGGAPASPSLHPTDERGERGGAAAAPAGRGLPQEARAARSRGKAKTGTDAMR